MIRKLVWEFWKNWQQFWFESDAPMQIALFRFFFGINFFIAMLMRATDTEFLFFYSGVMPKTAVDVVSHYDLNFTILDYLPGNAWIVVFTAILLLSTIAFTFGKWPRISALLALITHASLMYRNPAQAYGLDFTASFYFLFSIAMSTNKPRERMSEREKTWVSIGLRLSQIQLCVIYFYAGVKKLLGPAWWQGDAIWNMVANPVVARFDWTWMGHVPLLILGLTYLTVLWETYFPVLIWTRAGRLPMLVVGVFMHLGIATTMALPCFGFAMMSIYFLFLTDSEARTVIAFLKRVPSTAAVTR